MQPFFTVACIGCKNTRLIIIIEDGFIKAGDNLDEDVLIDVNDNHNNKYNMSAIVRMISKLLKNTYKIIVLGSVVLLQLKWRYLTLRKFSPYYESQMKNVTKYKSFSFVTDMRNSPFSPHQTIFNWEPALWTLMSVAWVYLFIYLFQFDTVPRQQRSCFQHGAVFQVYHEYYTLYTIFTSTSF